MPKILITGPPRSGKSTLISKLLSYYRKKNFKIYGFLTPEKIKDKKRIGFDVEDILSGDQRKLARIGNFNTPHRLGKYCVFIDEFEKTLSTLKNIEEVNPDLIIIDEIGKMELLSKKFQEIILTIFQLDFAIIATVGQKLRHTIKNKILQNPNIILLNVNRENQDKMFHKILSIIS